MHRRTRKYLTISAAIVTIVLVAYYVLLIHVLPYAFLQPGRALPTGDLTGITTDSLEVNGVSLTYNYLEPDSAVGNLILLHGVGSHKEVFADFQRTLARKRISSYALDLRHHGASGGMFATYGHYEKQDVATFIRRRLSDLPTGLFGNSMGAAIALQATAVSGDVDFVIAESSFASLPEVVGSYGKRLSRGLVRPWMARFTMKKAGELADFNPWRVSPEIAAAKIDVPALLVHGDQDEHIGCQHSKRIYRNLTSGDKQLVILPGGNHLNLHQAGGDAYTAKLDSFISIQYLNPVRPTRATDIPHSH